MKTIKPSKKELADKNRRSRLLYYILKGYSKSDIFRKVAHDFNCLEQTVQQDINKIDKWIISVLPRACVDSEIRALEQLQLEIWILTQILYKIYNKRGNSQIGLYALKNRSNILDSQNKILGITKSFKNYVKQRRELPKSKTHEEINQILFAAIQRYKNQKKKTCAETKKL
jgi:hypothetical protein